MPKLIKIEKLRDFLQEINPDLFIDRILVFGEKALTVIAILVIGFWLASKLTKIIYLFMIKRKIEKSLRNYLKEVIKIGLNIIVILSAIAAVGIDLTGLLAVIGGAAIFFGIGLQGGVSNLAGGLMIIFSKPYKIGDLIQMQGKMGYVESIDMFNTTIRTINNEFVILPNAPVFIQTVTNYSTKGTIRIDVTVGIEYETDYKKLIQLLRSAIREDNTFSNNHPIIIGIQDFSDSSITLAVRAHTKTINYWEAPLKLNKIIKDTMDEHGYKIPFPQRDLHIINKTDASTTEHQLPISTIKES